MNTTIDFYLHKSETTIACLEVACRLLEKAYEAQHQVYVLCTDKKAAEHLDEYLWTYREDSFVPHHLIGEGPVNPSPIQLGWSTSPNHQRDILMLLGTDLPEDYTRFKRVLIVINPEPIAREAARLLYRQLRAQGFTLGFHQLT